MTAPTTDPWRAVLARQWRSMCHLAERPIPAHDDVEAGRVSFPKTMSNRARTMVLWALLVADEDGLVDVAELQDAMGFSTRRAMLRVCAEVTQAGMWRRTVAGRRPFRLSYAAVFRGRGWTTCMHCPRPVIHGAQKARYCATCMATVVRHDRQWRTIAFEIWAGAKPGESDAKIVYRIHAHTDQPLFTRRGEDGDPGKEGVVNWMVGMGLLKADEWQHRLKAHTHGEVEG